MCVNIYYRAHKLTLMSDDAIFIAMYLYICVLGYVSMHMYVCVCVCVCIYAVVMLHYKTPYVPLVTSALPSCPA